MIILRTLALLALLVAPPAAATVEPFLSPAVTQGQIDVRLAPTEGVAAGTPVRVTFGVPFPRGSITTSGLATVTVRRGNGQEIAAHVEQLTPWRHRNNAAIDGQSVRVAEIQISYSFAAAYPAQETIQVSWGGAARGLDVPGGVDPRSAWHAVTSGSFLAADGISEPDVYALLPPDWLSRGALTAVRMSAFEPGNAETRDDPATNQAIAHWPNRQESEHAFKNNFYTVLNRDDPAVQDFLTGTAPDGNPAPQINLVHYRGDCNAPCDWNPREPWLYDRAATMFVLYLRSGYFTALREAVRSAEYYAHHVDADGYFDRPDDSGTVPPFDTKYSYAESPAYAYWLTGDPQMPAVVDRVSTAQNDYNHVWSDSLNFWTERHSAFKLLAKVVAYELNGGSARAAEVDQILADFRVHQNGANGFFTAAAFPGLVDGGLYHNGNQHSCDFPCDAYGASSWMSALLANAAVRAYATGEDAATAQFVSRLGTFLEGTLLVTDQHPCDDPVAQSPLPHAVPRYTVLTDGSTGQNEYEDIEHALDVGSQLAWARYFRELGGGDGSALAQSANDLYSSYDACVNYWIRPGAPAGYGKAAFRVSPPRKLGWEHRISGGLAVALANIDTSLLFRDGFE